MLNHKTKQLFNIEDEMDENEMQDLIQTAFGQTPSRLILNDMKTVFEQTHNIFKKPSKSTVEGFQCLNYKLKFDLTYTKIELRKNIESLKKYLD